MGVARGEEGEGCRPRVVGVQATKASMSQNVDRERRVPLPLSFTAFVHDQASPGGRSRCRKHVEMITVR